MNGSNGHGENGDALADAQDLPEANIAPENGDDVQNGDSPTNGEVTGEFVLEELQTEDRTTSQEPEPPDAEPEAAGDEPVPDA